MMTIEKATSLLADRAWPNGWPDYSHDAPVEHKLKRLREGLDEAMGCIYFQVGGYFTTPYEMREIVEAAAIWAHASEETKAQAIDELYTEWEELEEERREADEQ